MLNISVIPGERMYLVSQSQFCRQDICRIGPGRNIDILPGARRVRLVAAADDGRYCIHEDLWDKKMFSLLTYSSDGRLQARWETPRLESLAIGPDGLIYAAVDGEMRVMVFDMRGELRREIDVGVLPGSVRGTHCDMQGLQLDGNGDMYFVDWGYIVRLDKDGKPLARWIPYRPPETTREHLDFRDVAVRNGVVYGLVYTLNGPIEFQAFAPDGQCIARYIRPELPLELPGPIAVQTDGSYAVAQTAVVSSPKGALLFDRADNPVGSIESCPHITSIVARPGGGYYVAHAYHLNKLDAEGQNTVVMDSRFPDGDMTFQLAMNPRTGDLWALGCGCRIMVFGPDDKLLKRMELSEDIGFRCIPEGMAIGPDGSLYLSHTVRHQVIRCDEDGNFVAAIGKEGSGLGELRRPKGILVDSEGRLIVADTGNSRIQVFSPDGEPVGVWGRRGSGNGELDRPVAMALGPGNVLWIADTHNDRIVRVPLSEFWQQLTKDIKPPPPYVPPKKEPIPTPGTVTVEAIVVAGTDDFTDVIYIESADRAWGMRITLPAGSHALREERCRITGVLQLKERAARHLVAQSVEPLPAGEQTPEPLGMANLYVGDGYRAGDKPVDLSNLGLLVKTWGRVVSVDLANKRFVINDGSSIGEGAGLEVYGGQLRSPLASWPKVGQYVAVTGISAVRPAGDGTFRSAIRVRGQDDIEVLVEE